MCMSYLIKYYTLSLLLIPLCIKLKRAYGYNFDFLISRKLLNIWSLEQMSMSLVDYRLIIYSSKVWRFLLKFGPVKV